ncbi:MAG: amidohydrolase family protein [Bacteroidota bacterium]
MKYFTADYIFPVSSPLLENGVVITDDAGVILDIVSKESIQHPISNIQHLKGIIVPGFINAHCHLELSHLKAQISEKKQMHGFISELLPRRGSFTAEQIKAAIAEAEAEMLRNGIVAVGDISNTDHSFEQKAKKNLYYHTFIEAFDLAPEKAAEVFRKGKELQKQLENIPLPSHKQAHPPSKGELPFSIVPHAPYTVSPELFGLIYDLQQDMVCIHNQESRGEDELFRSKSGPMAELFSRMGMDLPWIKGDGKDSLRYTLSQLNAHRIQLVHNTYTSADDLSWANSKLQPANLPGRQAGCKLFWCTCPNANLYIEDRLPDYQVFLNEKVTIGTDSYASNWSLSILDEMKTIQKHFPSIAFEKLLEWGTKNGAEFLGIDERYGTIATGKAPGLNLIEHADLSGGEVRLTEKSRVRKLA